MAGGLRTGDAQERLRRLMEWRDALRQERLEGRLERQALYARADRLLRRLEDALGGKDAV